MECERIYYLVWKVRMLLKLVVYAWAIDIVLLAVVLVMAGIYWLIGPCLVALFLQLAYGLDLIRKESATGGAGSHGDAFPGGHSAS